MSDVHPLVERYREAERRAKQTLVIGDRVRVMDTVGRNSHATFIGWDENFIVTQEGIYCPASHVIEINGKSIDFLALQ